MHSSVAVTSGARLVTCLWMKKTLFYRLFGWGQLPKAMRPILESEGIVLFDEGLGGTITLRNYRSPTRWSSYRCSWFTGSLVVTGIRFAAFSISRPLINVPLDVERLRLLDCSIEKGTKLKVAYDAADFDDNTTGKVELRFRTAKARLFLERIQAAK